MWPTSPPYSAGLRCTPGGCGALRQNPPTASPSPSCSRPHGFSTAFSVQCLAPLSCCLPVPPWWSQVGVPLTSQPQGACTTVGQSVHFPLLVPSAAGPGHVLWSKSPMLVVGQRVLSFCYQSVPGLGLTLLLLELSFSNYVVQ